MGPKIKTKSVDKQLYRNYLLKTDQFLSTAEQALVEKQWNSVGLNAVHAAICASDALCVFYRQQRSVSEKHNDAVVLLLSIFSDEEAKKSSNHLIWLVGRKNLIEYEARLFFETEAFEAIKHAERFIEWIKNKLPR